MTFHSQAGQDQFVLGLIGDRGMFLDVGASDPIVYSNTYALEQAGWSGLLVDRAPHLAVVMAAKRRSPFLCADATTVNWPLLLAQHGLLSPIDYLSFDVDDSARPAFRAMPWDRVRFRILTVEHDAYRFGDDIRREMRGVLRSHGYDLLCPDVMNDGAPFEDWWVDPNSVDMTIANRYRRATATDWNLIVAAGR